MTSRNGILQIKVTLRGIRPPIWRRLQVPASYSFWDLHVAIQDAMGWVDYHLHEFRVAPVSGHRPLCIGIPGEEALMSEQPILPAWEIPVLRYLSAKGAQAVYTYDFGDGWKHTVAVEDVLSRVPGAIYPRCVAGRRKCPPEDVGGVWGYERFLAALADPADEEHESYLTWVGGSYDPEGFDADSVRFDDPEKHWRSAFFDGDEDEA
jgi:hypothetical protein